MNGVLTALRRHGWALAIAVLLASTQLVVLVPNPFSLGGAKAVRGAEIVMVAVAAALVWALTRRDRPPLSRPQRLAVAAVVATGVAWAVMVVLRRLLTGHLVVAITMGEYLVMGLAAYLLLSLRRVPRSEVVGGVAVFLLGANVWALAQVLQGHTIRTQALLGNINYYVGVALMALPTLALTAVRSQRRWVRLALLLVVASTLANVMLSGSRFGGVAMVACAALTAGLVHPGSWRRRLRDLGVVVLVALAVFALLAVANRKQLGDVARTFNLTSVITGQEPDTEEIVRQQQGRQQEAPHITEQDHATTPGDPDHDAPPAPPALNILNHTRVAERALAVVKDHWLLGTGRIGPYFSGYGYQPAHNIELEAVLYLGLVGAVPFFLALAALAWSCWRRGDRSAWLLGFAGLFSFAQFQPLLSDGLVCILPMWILAAALAARAPGRIAHRRQAADGGRERP